MLISENKVNLRENSTVFQKIPVREASLKFIVESLLDKLSAKQKLVLSSRLGVGNDGPKTLEAIGKNLNVTRERVRQIEGDAVKALGKIKKGELVEKLISLVGEIIGEYGGIVSDERLVKEVLSRYSGKSDFSEDECRAIEVIFLLAGLERVKNNLEIRNSWTSPDFDKKYFRAAVSEIEAIFDAAKSILNIEEILKELDNRDFTQKFPQMKPEHIVSFLEVSKKFGQNVFSDWGRARWPLICPRGIREKSTLVLMKKGKPLHFREISRLIEEMKLSEKKVHSQTVHNELIRDKRFVLVGRGTYALRNWGYEEGTVKEIIINLLKSAGGFLGKDKLYREVLKKRKVKKATIAVNLADKKTFEKRDGGYQLKAG